MRILEARGHEIKVVARDKDILLKLLNEEKIGYTVFGVHRKNIVAKYISTLSILISYNKVFKQFKPDVVISKASFYSCFLALFRKTKSIIFPDSEVVFVTNKIVSVLADKIITPENFELNFGTKHLKISGFFENCYLHPSVFQVDEAIINSLKKPYAIVRFIGWTANHDLGEIGLTIENKIRLVKHLSNYFNVYISSESGLPNELADYELKTPKSSIHSVLYGASLYVGDSQTMATEAALLGTPAIRSNSFVGANDMSNFRLLENKYKLLKNISSFDNILTTIDDLSGNACKADWTRKAENYFISNGNTNEILANMIESI